MLISIIFRKYISKNYYPLISDFGYVKIVNSESDMLPCHSLNLYIGGWSPIASTRHFGHQWPIVPAPGDYDDGEMGGLMIGRGN
jgi:hypothetical protein